MQFGLREKTYDKFFPSHQLGSANIFRADAQIISSDVASSQWQVDALKIQDLTPPPGIRVRKSYPH